MATVSSLARRLWKTLCGLAAAAIVTTTSSALPAGTGGAGTPNAAGSPAQGKLSDPIKSSPDYRVTFTITQTDELSKDQITIIFSDRSWETRPLPPVPLFGEDINEEFSFSAADFANRPSLTFTRVVRDLTFLKSQYIRVVNHGSDSWGGDTITITVNGRREISNVRMLPKKGDAKSGFQGANRSSWKAKTYWEEQLNRLRANPTSQ